MPLKELAERRNLLHHKSDPQTVLRHALDDLQIGPVALVSSFGTESVVLLHMVSQIDAGTPVIFLDTEMLFPETLDYQRKVAAHLGLRDVRIVRPDRGRLLERDVDGVLHRGDPNACCDLRKTAPLDTALAGFGCWITGRKRVQGGQRAQMRLYEKDSAARIKINPLAGFSQSDVQNYIRTHELPKHPLVASGFGSIGCAPCTTKIAEGEDPRAGRWRGQEKTECGIHFYANQPARHKRSEHSV